MKMPDMRNLTRGALFLALGVVLPMAFHMAGGPSVGRVFLPMHIPVLLCGFFCGPGTGFLVGTITPLLSGMLTGMPPFMPPTAQVMMWELGTYGLLTGLLYHRARLGVYPALLVAMVSGRLVYGLLGYFVLPMFGLKQVPLLYPLTYGLVTALPGIATQLVVVPLTVLAVTRNASVLVLGDIGRRARAPRPS